MHKQNNYNNLVNSLLNHLRIRHAEPNSQHEQSSICEKPKNFHVVNLLIIILICLLIEIFICNANSFRVINKDKFEQKRYTLDQLEITSADVNTAEGTITYRSEYGGNLFIHIKDIDTAIGTVYLDLTFPDDVLEYIVCYTDEANAGFYRSFTREYVTGVDKTKWFTCHFNGKSKEMIIRFDNLKDGYEFSLNEIQINRPIPVYFSLIRFTTILIIICNLYLIRKTSFFMSRQKSIKHNLALAGVYMVFLIVSIVIYTNSYSDIKLNIMYNSSFPDALINKRLDLDIEVSESLKAIENPYDTSMRQILGVDYSWDTAYYNGKYYCYFGVVPALLFFVPYKLITNSYLQCNIVVIIAYCIYMLFLDFTFLKIIRHIMADVQFGVEFVSMIILNSAINVFYFAAEPSFYLVLYSVGLMFVSIGFFCFTVWYTGSQKNKLLLFSGALCLSLSVGCRPPLLMYTLIIIPFGIKVICAKKNKSITDMVVLLIPYLIIGTALALYNYMRFDSILEFGTKYQLTAQDQLHSSNTIYEVPTLLWIGFFQPLNFSAIFPYIHATDSANNYAGYFFIGSGLTPLLSQAPILLVLFMPTVWKIWKKSHDIFCNIVLPFSALTGIVMLVLLYLNSGVEWRYTSEIAPTLCITAIILIANILKKEEGEKATFLMTVLFIIAIYCFAVAFFRALSGPFGYTRAYHPEFYYTLERMCSFWK